MHHIDRDCPWGGNLASDGATLPAKARCSTSAATILPAGTSLRPQELAKSRHFLGLISEQSLYNLLERTVELEVIQPVRPTASASFLESPRTGLLGGALELTTSGRRAGGGRSQRYRDPSSEVRSVRAVLPDAQYHAGHRRPRLAAASTSGDRPIIGPRTMEQLTADFQP